MSENLVSDIIAKLGPYCEDKIGLDIGANHGSYTTMIAEKCKQAYAFEPNLVNFKVLMFNVHAKNVIFVNGMVLDKTGPGRLYLCKSNPGGHTAAYKVAEDPRYDHLLDRFEEVHSVSLDTYFGDATNIGFMKIDVEGAEEFVLRGADKILSNNKLIIALETHQTIDREGIYRYMADKGYVFLDENFVPVSSIQFDYHYIIHNHGDNFVY